MNRYPQCCVCVYADFGRLGKPKCKKDNKHIIADATIFAMCKNYEPKKKPE